METVVYQRGVTPGSVEDVQIGPGKYRAYLKLPEIPLLKWWYDHTYKPLYHAVIFGSDQKVDLRLPIEVEGQTRMKRVTVREPSIVDDTFILDFEIYEDPAAWVIIIAILATLGIVGVVGAILLDKLTKFTDASGVGEVIKGIADALKNVSGPVGVLLVVAGVLGIIALLPGAIKTGKGAAKSLGLK
jgi:hypothetical protein